MKRLMQVLAAVFLFVAAVGFSVLFTLHFRPQYYFDIGYLNLSADSGLVETEIRENYDALIDYCTGFSDRELQLPSLPSSEQGTVHFAEVQTIFRMFGVLFLAGFLLSALFIWLLRREKPAYLLIFSAFSIAIPAIIGLSIAINWQAVFFLMHRVLFRNTYWFFDPETDPVILILPSEFFMHCGVMIVCLILLFAAVSFGIYWVMRRRLRKKRQIIKVSAEQKPEEKQPVSVS